MVCAQEGVIYVWYMRTLPPPFHPWTTGIAACGLQTLFAPSRRSFLIVDTVACCGREVPILGKGAKRSPKSGALTAFSRAQINTCKAHSAANMGADMVPAHKVGLGAEFAEALCHLSVVWRRVRCFLSAQEGAIYCFWGGGLHIFLYTGGCRISFVPPPPLHMHGLV